MEDMQKERRTDKQTESDRQANKEDRERQTDTQRRQREKETERDKQRRRQREKDKSKIKESHAANVTPQLRFVVCVYLFVSHFLSFRFANVMRNLTADNERKKEKTRNSSLGPLL